MEITPAEFREVQSLVRLLCGLVLTDDKTYLLRTRLASIVAAHRCRSFSDYVHLLRQTHSAALRDELVEALTTGETSFNRDGHPFDEFRRRIMTRLSDTIRRRREGRLLAPVARIWSAGCSTGQEPYSLAIAVQEALRDTAAMDLQPENFPILATDLSAKSLAVARTGRYHERDLTRGLTSQQRDRYFQATNEGFEVVASLRRRIEFCQLNFMNSTSPLGPFDVIFCRNVLIYFDIPTRQRLVNLFHDSLHSGGRLILGAAESLYGLSTPFVAETLGTTTAYSRP